MFSQNFFSLKVFLQAREKQFWQQCWDIFDTIPEITKNLLRNFNAKCSSGHVECIFDNHVEKLCSNSAKSWLIFHRFYSRIFPIKYPLNRYNAVLTTLPELSCFFFLSNSWENFVFPKFSRKTFHDTFIAVLTSLSTHFRSNSVKQIDSLFSIFLGQKNLPRAKKKRCATSPKEVFNFHNILPNFFPETVPLDT